MKYNVGPMIVTSSKSWPSVIYENTDIQPLPEGAEIEGYSTVGISEWLYSWLRRSIPLKDMLEDYEVSKDDFLNEIQTALEELGMYDNTGNRG